MAIGRSENPSNMRLFKGESFASNSCQSLWEVGDFSPHEPLVPTALEKKFLSDLQKKGEGHQGTTPSL
jgi:hypothetical protein